MYTEEQWLVRKWQKTGLMDGIKSGHELDYANVLETEAKKLIDHYSGRGETPNIWPQLRRDHAQWFNN